MAEGTFPPCKLIMLKNNSPNTIVIQGPKEIHGFDPPKHPETTQQKTNLIGTATTAATPSKTSSNGLK